MTTDPPPALQPDHLQAKVVEAMEAARRKAGLSAEAMARALRPSLQLPEMPAGHAVRSNWYGWRKTPKSIPAIALLAAAELAGTTVDGLLTGSVKPAVAERVDDLELQVAQLRRLLGQVEGELSAVQRRLGPLPATDGDRGE